MGCGALSFEKARTEDDEKRDAAANKIQTTFCTKADHELKIVVDSASSIVQRLGKAVREHDEAAIRYELVQIQKLSPPTIALVRAHAGGRTIKLPTAAGHALADDIMASLEAGSGAPLGVMVATERVLKVFSWDGHRPDQSGDLIADDAGSWELFLDGGGKVEFNDVWRQLRVQSSIGQLLEVLPEKRWRIDAATLALQELKLACPHANCARFEVANILSDILVPQIEVEFGEGAQWERTALERMQVLLAAMFHVGGNTALLKLLDEAFGLIDDHISGVRDPSCHYFLLWDGLLRCAQHLRPSLFPAGKEDTGSYVRVVGNRDSPELNGFFGRVVDAENGIELGKARNDEEFVGVQIGNAKAKVPSGSLAQASIQLDKALRRCMKPEYLDFLQTWLDELCNGAASAAKQPDIAPAKSSQFTSTTDRVVCSVCSTFVFFVDKESSCSCVTCGLCVTAGFQETSSRDCNAARREVREFELGVPTKLAVSIWRCPKCNEEFQSWEDEGDEDGLLSHLRETGHATAKNGKKKFRIGLSDVSSVEEGCVAGSSLEEEMQILRVYRLLHISNLVGSENAGQKFAETLKRRYSQLSTEPGNRLLLSASFAGVPLGAVDLVYPPLIPVHSAFVQCLKDKDWEPVSRCFAKLSPVSQALAVGLPELDSLLQSYRETLPSVANNFQALKEALLLVYNIPAPLRGSVLEATEYQEALVRCRKAGELPDSWDLSGLLEDSNSKQRESVSKISILHDGVVNRVEEIDPSPTNNLSRKTLDASLVAHFQGFVDATWVKKWSRDRKGDPWGEDVPSSFTVKEVVQVMNMQNWQDYLEVRRALGKPDQILKDIDAALTDEPGGRLTASYSVVGEHLKHHLNEVWLWHGTKPIAADSIVANDFEISKAGSHRGTLYGNGIYLAESSTKADEYCRETNLLGWRSMLLCRCVMGKYYYCNKETTGEECEKAVMKDKYHSVLGDRRKLRNSFREFVFYDHRQVYPCFLVFYERGDPIPHESKKKTDS